MVRAGEWIAIAGLAALMAGCLAGPPTEAALTAALTQAPPAFAAGGAPLTSVPSDLAVETQTAGAGQIVLTVWMPDALYASSDSPGGKAFLDQLAAFDDQRPDIRVEVMTKRLRGAGGILAYLQSAPPVAPSILPDITLLDRDALADAGHARLIVPVRNLTGLAALANLFPAAREVGAIDGNLTGLAYLLEVDQTIYRQSVFRTPPESFGQVLESGQLFAFLAGASSGVSPVILLQYLAAGGKLVDDGGQPALDASPLAQVLSFYGQAKIRGNVTPELFQLPDQASVWGLYRARQTNLAAVTSTQVITGLDQVSGSKLGAIPTADGKLYTLARGWSWVVVTHDLDRQAAAIALLNFLMNPVNHSQYSQAAHWLPSQPAALAMWSSEDGNLVAFATSLLTNAHAMPDSATRGSPGAAMQTALEAVILNGASPAQAAGHAADLVKAGQGRAP